MSGTPTSGPAHERLAPTTDGLPAPKPAPRASGPWLGTPSGIIAVAALVLSVFVPPAFFPLAGLAFVLGIVALVRRRPRPRSAWIITISSGVLLVVVLAIGILATVLVFDQEVGSPSPAAALPPAPAISAEAI